MPRSIWNGTITFGMVNVPIKLYSATESKTVHFHEVHVKDGARIEHRRICPKEEREVPYEQIVRGYEVAPDEYVVLEKEEIKAAAGDRGKVVHLDEFVEAADIDPVFYDKTYYVGSREDPDPYRLLHDALRRSDRAGIGRFTFHDREYLVAVRALDGVMALHTLRFHDEVMAGEDLEPDASGRDPSPIHFDHPYYLVPAGESEGTLRAYRLLLAAMERAERVALGRLVMRTKEYLVAVRVREGALALTTMLFHDEVRSTDPIETGGKKPTRKTLENALAIVEELSTDWDPERYTDCYRERLKRVIDRKRKGERVRAPKPERQPAPAPDLMAALQRTLDNLRDGGDARNGSDELERLDREELYRRAQEAGVSGRSKMSKDELVKALSNGE